MRSLASLSALAPLAAIHGFGDDDPLRPDDAETSTTPRYSPRTTGLRNGEVTLCMHAEAK
jgi:hypothetical protein